MGGCLCPRGFLEVPKCLHATIVHCGCRHIRRWCTIWYNFALEMLGVGYCVPWMTTFVRELLLFLLLLNNELQCLISLDNFIMGVLHILNVGPTQLHPNSWASLQAFRLLWAVLSLQPTLMSFLHFYSTKPEYRVHWLSFISQPRSCLLASFTFSYNNFKGEMG